MDLLFSQLVNGISSSAELFIICIGMVIIFGMLDVVNMAHGAFIMLGAYVSCICINRGHMNFWVSLVLAFAVTALIGIVVERLLIRKLYQKVAETLLITFALTYLIEEIVRMIFGPENQNVELPLKGNISVGNVTIPYYNIFMVVMAVFILLGTLALFYKTKYGMQLRAITQNRQMSQCLGINTIHIDRITFAYGCGLAGLAGAIIAPVSSVTPGMGAAYNVDSFLVVILGGLNSIVGSFAGSFVLEESVSVMASGMSLVTAKLLVFVIIIVLIRFKPQGLFTAKDKR